MPHGKVIGKVKGTAARLWSPVGLTVAIIGHQILSEIFMPYHSPDKKKKKKKKKSK
jgi:hypothetical protein